MGYDTAVDERWVGDRGDEPVAGTISGRFGCCVSGLGAGGTRDDFQRGGMGSFILRPSGNMIRDDCGDMGMRRRRYRDKMSDWSLVWRKYRVNIYANVVRRSPSLRHWRYTSTELMGNRASHKT